jgi:uncharacterized membrane protein YdjX (TVP38/TMEM64 family)
LQDPSPPPTHPGHAAPPRAKGTAWRSLPFAVLLIGAALGTFALRDQISFAALAEHRETLIGLRDANYPLAALGFIAAYVVVVGFSLPGALIATLAGGFLFGVFPGVLFNVTGATLGAIAIFLAARAGLGARVSQAMEARGGAVARLQAGLIQNEWSVLFLMRLVPVVPFFLANLVPAFVGVRLSRFAITTFFGILPGSLVYTSVGAGLGDVFAQGRTPDLSIFFTLPVLGPILGLAALAALPMILRLWRGKEL